MFVTFFWTTFYQQLPYCTFSLYLRLLTNRHHRSGLFFLLSSRICFKLAIMKHEIISFPCVWRAVCHPFTFQFLSKLIFVLFFCCGTKIKLLFSKWQLKLVHQDYLIKYRYQKLLQLIFLYLKVVKTVAKNSNIVGNKFSIFKIFFVCH